MKPGLRRLPSEASVHMWIDRAIGWIFPSLALQGTPWYHLWQTKERKDFLFLPRVLFTLGGLGYIAHYVLFDRVMNLQPVELWFTFRMSMGALTLATAAYYFIPTLYEVRFYKIPAIVAGAICAYFQARVLVWYEGSLYLYAFAFVIVATVVLRLSIGQSLLYAGLLIAAQWDSYLEAGIDKPLLWSASIVTLVFLAFARSGYSAELQYFRANQENVENQKRIIELNIEFADRVRAFLPKEISARLFRYVDVQRMTILQAIEEVLRPRHREIACLFSDIRGFTKATQGIGDTYLDDGVIPNVKQCTEAVERSGGIPRKIGDLLFAYFDAPEANANLAHCLKAAIEVIQVNSDFNASRPGKDPINRYVLMTSGEAIVGNLGGFDSSIEITALGNPVNFLSRIDEATKQPALRQMISSKHIVIDERTARLLMAIVPGFEPEALSLRELGVTIRDFESVDQLFLYCVDDAKSHFMNLQIDGIVGTHVTDTRRVSKQIQTIRA